MPETQPRAQQLYRKLPRGRSRLSRQDVARDQRTRIYGAMIDAVGRGGYQRTAVADVIARAGVSRRAFYELFRDKHQCLLATHNAIVGHARGLTIAAWKSENRWSNQLHSACRQLFDLTRERPEQARFVLVDSPGSVPGARERARIASLAFERPLHSVLHSPSEEQLPCISAAAIVGGIRQVIFSHVREGCDLRPRLAEEIVDWAASYRATSAPALLARPSPSTNAHDSTAPVVDSARAEVIDTLIRLTYERGYGAITDADLAHASHISTHAFHKLYADKEACLLSARSTLIDSTMATARREMQYANNWAEEVRVGIMAMAGALADNPGLARVALVDFQDIGGAAVQQADHPLAELEALFTRNAPRVRIAGQLTPQLVTAALWTVVSAHAIGGMLNRLPDVVDLLAYIVLAPYLGARTALAEISGVAEQAA